MKSSRPLWLVLLLVGAEMMVASNGVNETGVREPVRQFPPLMEMARRFRA